MNRYHINVGIKKLTGVWFFCLMLVAMSNAQGRSEQYTQMQESHSHPIINIGMGEFRVFATDETINLLGNKFKDLLTLGFLSVERIHVADISPGIQTANERSQQSQSPIQESRKIDYKALADKEIEFYLTGAITLYESKISVDITVHNIEDETSERISTGYKNLSEIYRIMEEISQKLTSYLIEHASGDDIISVGFTCFENKWGNSGEASIFYASDLPRSTYFNFGSKGEINLLPPTETVINCDSPTNLSELFYVNDLDILVTGEFEFVGNTEIWITPMLIIKDLEKTVDLFVIKGDRNNYSEVQSILSSDVRQFVEGIIDSTGQLITEPFEDINPTSNSYWMDAIDAFNNGNLFLSEFLMKKVIEMSPEELDPYYNLGLIMERRGNYTEAREAFNQALALDPDYLEAKEGKAYSLLMDGQYEVALELFKEIQKSDSTYPYLHYHLGQIYYYLEDFDNAINELSLSAQRGDQEPYYGTYLLMGRVYQKQGRLDESIEAYQKSLELDAVNSDALWYLSDIYQNKALDSFDFQNYQEAYKYLLTAKDYNETYYIYDNLRFALNKLGEIEKVDFLINEGIEKGFFDENKIHFTQGSDLRYYYFSEVNRRSEYLESAISHLKLHLQKNPGDAEAYFMIGNSYNNLGISRESLRYLELAFENNPVDNTIILDLAEIQIIENQSKKAQATLENFVVRNEESEEEVSQQLLSKYLGIVANKLNNEPTSEMEEMLRIHLDQGLKVYGWSYRPFLNWLENANIQDELKTEIEALTLTMEENTIN